MKEHSEKPEMRIAQKALAKEFITDLHGKEEYESALKISESLFSGSIDKLSEKEIEDAFKGIEPFNISSDTNIVDLLVDNKICSSKREAREFINNNSITINGTKINDLEYVISKNNSLFNKYIIVRRGKKKYFVGIFK